MSDERPEGLNTDAEREEAHLRRPEEEVKDLEAPPEESKGVRGGLKIGDVEGESGDSPHK